MRVAVHVVRNARLALAVMLGIAVGLLPGSASTAATGAPDAPAVPYTCALTSGSQEVGVIFRQAYPDSATAGQPFAPGALTAAVTIPRAGLSAMLPDPADTLAGTARLAVHVAQGAAASDTTWTGLTAPATPAGGTDDVTLDFAGAVPPLTVDAAGDVTFDAGVLTLTLHPAPATGTPPATAADGGTQAPAGTADPAATPTPTASGTPAPAAEVLASCAPHAGRTAVRLGTVSVTGDVPPGSGSPTATGTAPLTTSPGTTSPGTTATGSAAPRALNGTLAPQAAPALSHVHDCPPPPSADPDPAVLAEQAKKRPPNPIVYPPPGAPPVDRISQCGFITGLSNVAKLNGASVLNPLTAPEPALTDIAAVGSVFSFADPDNPYVELDSVVAFDIPPARTAFLTYGFMPTTATMRLTTVGGVMTVVSTGTLGQLVVDEIHGKDALQLTDVEVDGTRLDVGPNCRTEAPLDIHMFGVDRSYLDGRDAPTDYKIQTGGPLFQDDLYIPPFRGCRSPTGENLDALFTSSISGRGNSLNLIQGPLCVPASDPTWCLPAIPYPVPPHR